MTSEHKDDQYYLDLGKDNPPPPELLEKLSKVGDGATIHAIVGVASVLGQFTGKSNEEIGELVASMPLALGFKRA